MLDLKLKSMILSLSLGLILSSSLAWLMNQVKPSQAELKLLYFITCSSLNIICRLVSSSSQTWTFYFCYRTKLEHSLLDKAWLVYSPTNVDARFFAYCFVRIVRSYCFAWKWIISLCKILQWGSCWNLKMQR